MICKEKESDAKIMMVMVMVMKKVCFGITVVCLAAAVSSKVSQEGERGLEVPA